MTRPRRLTDEQIEEWLAQVRRAAKIRDDAAMRYSLRLAQVRTLMRDANRAGVPVTQIAQAAGVARTRAHRLIANAGGKHVD